MLANKETTFIRTATVIDTSDGCVTVRNNKGEVLLNTSASIIWNYIDGFHTINDIYQNMIVTYSENNSPEYIEEIISKGIEILVENQVIQERK